jgi:isopentenyl-diphosphate delta-isomerase
MERAQRKLEHIKYALELGDGPRSTHFEDIRFLHNCLPEINPADIILSVKVLGKQLRLPFLIDAITGGTDAVVDVNAKVAQAAAALGIGMAVGSQYGAVRDGKGYASYEVVRKYNPDGLVFANISALATPEQAREAVKMLNADAIEVHLNPAQELFMGEGDKDFRGLLDNMLRIKDATAVPVIVKETGCGIAKEEYARLKAKGFTSFDCAGAGGTNLPAIEAARYGKELAADFADWGLPTTWTLLDGAVTLSADDLLIGSGGIRNAGDVAKAFALGADVVGITGIALRLIQESGVEAVVTYFEELSKQLTNYMLLLGATAPCDLRKVPVIYSGETANYIANRDYDLIALSNNRR